MKLEISFLKKAIPYAFLYQTTGGFNSLKSLFKLPCDEIEGTVSIDTRTLEQGQFFFALQGEKVDGHSFIPDAITKGARAIFINESKLESIKEEILDEALVVFVVPDTEQALLDLARVWRQHFVYHVVAVTGSVGKTTTKEMLRSIFRAAEIEACISFKNQNTLIGVALNILKMHESHKVAIFEVGISEKGEMKEKAELLRPTIGVITTVAHSHMQGLGTINEIAQEKLALFSCFAPGSVGVVFGDNKLLDQAYYTHPVVRFGFKTKNHIQARKIKVEKRCDGVTATTFTLRIYKTKSAAREAQISLKTNHMGMIANVLAAVTVSHLLDVPLETIVKGIRTFKQVEGRFETLHLKDKRGILINDCYNASPESMRSALMAVDQMEVDGAKIAVLGDMLELGEKEGFWHRQVGRILGRALSVKQVILVGERARLIAKTAPLTTKIFYASDWQEATKLLQETLTRPDSLVLVKGSNGMRLGNLVVQMT